MSTPQELHAKYRQLSKQFAAQRPNISPVAFALSEGIWGPESQQMDGDTIYKVKSLTHTAKANLQEMVFGDEMAGKVFPGSLLWARSLTQDGRLDPVLPMKRATPMIVTVSGAIMKPGKPTSYECDGTESGYASVLAQVLANIATTQAVISSQYSEFSDVAASMLQVGLSASGWGAKLKAKVETTRKSKQTCTLVHLSQAYFTLTAAPKAGELHLDEPMFATNPNIAELLVEQMESAGEIGVVRRVTYGRRILLSITSSSTQEELLAAIKASYKGFGASASGTLDATQTKVLNQAQTHLIVIGGKPHPILVDNLTMPAGDLLRELSKYLGDTVQMDELTSAAVMGFDVQYAYDLASAIKAESVNFSEQVRVSQRLKGDTTIIERRFNADINSAKVAILKGDSEIDSDDKTISIVQYELKPSLDRRALMLKITYDAIEGNSNGSHGDSRFQLVTKEIEVFRDPLGRTIRAVSSRPNGTMGSKQTVHVGKSLFSPQPVSDFNDLRDIKVTFDRKGSNDHKVMAIEGKVLCSVVLNDGNEQPVSG